MRTRLDEQHNGSYYLCLLERSEKEEVCVWVWGGGGGVPYKMSLNEFSTGI